MDLSVAPLLRVVHRRLEGRRTQGRDQRARDAHLHHTVLPQVRPEDYHAREFRFNFNSFG